MSILLAGCGGDTAVQRTLIPSAIPPTLTPRSTALPYVDDAPALGETGREITILFVGQGASAASDARSAGRELKTYLSDEFDRDIKVEFVDENTALAALCSGQPTAAWVSAFTYATAATQCGAEPVLAIERGKLPNVIIGRSADLITPTDITELGNLAGETFCRSEQHDLLTTWVLPSLLLNAQGVNPITDLGMTLDFPDDLSLLNAMVAGTCTAATLPEGEFEDLLIDLALVLSADGATVTLSDVQEQLHILVPAGETAAPSGNNDFEGFGDNVVPFEVLVFPPDTAIPTDPGDMITREKIVEAITDFFTDPVNGDDHLSDILDATGVFTVESGDLATFRALIASSGWDMTFSMTK